MRRTAMLLAALVLILGLFSTANAEEEATISFTFNMELVTVSIQGVKPNMLHDQGTKDMLKRVAQLAHYSLKQLRRQSDFPKCLAHGKREEDAEWYQQGPCLEWEK